VGFFEAKNKIKSADLEFLGIDRARAVGIEQLKGLADFLLLVLGEVEVCRRVSNQEREKELLNHHSPLAIKPQTKGNTHGASSAWQQLVQARWQPAYGSPGVKLFS
jgi:hypothetical protein